MPARRLRSRALIGALAGVVVSAGLVLTAAPDAFAALARPTGLTPASGTTEVTPVLRWSAVKGATSYDVEVATTADFADPVYDVRTVNRAATPTAQLPMVRLYWRVRATAGSTASSWASASFSRNRLNGPVLVSPLDGTTLAQPTTPPLLRWDAVPGATKYTVEVDNGADADFVGSKSVSTKLTSMVWYEKTQQDVGTTYSWRVTAEVGDGQLTFPSEARTYTLGPLPAISLDAPADNADVEEVVLDWDPVPGAVGYDLRVATDESFAADTIVGNVTNLRPTRYSPAKTYNVDDLFWQVRPINVYEERPDWGDVPLRHFRRTYEGPGAVPELLHPALAGSSDPAPVVGDDFYYQWTPARLASRYRIDVGPDRNFSPTTFVSCYTTQTTYTPYFARSPDTDDCAPPTIGATTYWRVKALDGRAGVSGEIQGVYSAIGKYIYDPGQVTLSSPANGASVPVPTLSWQPFIDADKYVVTIKGTNYSDDVTTYATSYTPENLDPTKGPFTWWVQAVDHYGQKTSVPIFGQRQFTVSGVAPTAGGAPLQAITPALGAAGTTRFPRLSWETYPGVFDHYEVWVGDAGSQHFAQLDARAEYPAWTDTSDDYLSPGSYDWFVTAVSASGTTVGKGATSTFTITDLALAGGQAVALQGDTLDADGGCSQALASPTDQVCTGMGETPVLDWDPVPGAGYYMVYLSKDINFQNMVFGSLSSSSGIPTTANTRWTPTVALSEGQAGVQAYYWFIRPCKSLGNCSPDPTRASHAFDKRSAPVSGLQTLGDLEHDLTFDWDDYLATNQDPVNQNSRTGEQPTQAAREYKVEVSASPNFTTVLDSATVDQTTYTAPGRTFPDGDLYWRVRAIDGSGNALASAATTQHVVKSSEAPALIGPFGASQTTEPYRWAPVQGAFKYEQQVYRDGDTAASAANLAAKATGISYTAVTYLKPLASGTTYVWRVRALDGDGNPGPWSTWGTFSIAGSAPVLGAPASAARVSSTQALFSWAATGNATSYRFERRLAGSTRIAEKVTTAQTAWAPVKKIDTGSWQWRVSSLDNEGDVIAASAWRSFTVDATAPTVKSYAPTRTARKASNFTLTFSEPVKGVTRTTYAIYYGGRTTPLKAVVTLSASGLSARLNPSAPLRKGKTYTIKVRSGVTDRAGLPLAPFSWKVTVS